MHTEQPIRSRRRPRPLQDSTPKEVYKKQKVEHPSQLPPSFWDNLSEVWLTRNALRELDRRNTQATANASTKLQFLWPVTRNELMAVQRFARQGGPDLSGLRGCPEPTLSSHRPYRIQKRRISASRGLSASRNSCALRSTKSTTTESSGPYDWNFQQHLTAHGIFPTRHRFSNGHIPSKSRNWDGILARLAQRRPSLSPPRFAEEDFEEFLRADAAASKERQVIEHAIIPFIEGKVLDKEYIGGGIPFKNLNHLTDGTLVPGNPNHYYGARPDQLDPQIQIELNGQIVPSTQHELPIAPNFFLVVKGPDRSSLVANRQACYDGAFGARGMHSLQEYNKDEPDFNNNASTLISIYHDEQLRMFTCHPSKSATSGRTEYYMTQSRG
ncbi:conserved hypothetical protein [Talaromyces stipitatus ATCC 10500]|uniref:Uncharacterized protein n=1 Tax=Talaromyces stipitatus (strain ATCC 10500 / CBS 375.48 / QM 6759 / NRRL 1006) TaxID=441959 RepID=B8M6F2_TALSN|nr:uncharacterized protein TSTA_026380 [Talaromyces stipitatus ATCC 10500]EED19327.1 conserved hypothetical protein [Talaromyces stipitatus ATCC 10500]